MKILILFFFGLSVLGSEVPNITPNNKFFIILNQIEASGKTGQILGDGGKALGPLQIHYSYWLDAVSFNKTIGGKYSDCADLNYSKKIVSSVLNKYCKNAVLLNDFEIMFRIHNGGPLGHKKSSTLNYWLKASKYLK